MDLRRLTLRIHEQKRQNAIITFENGQVVRRTHETVYADIKATAEKLKSWGIQPGMRVAIWACNCYEWIIHELALIELRALSVAFTDDFNGNTADQLIEKYALSLLLVRACDGPLKKSARQSSAVAFMDAANEGIKAIQREAQTSDYEFENIGMVFSSGSSGKLKGLALHRLGIEASVDAFTEVVGPRPEDCLLLFLPLSNFQQRLMYYSALWYGVDLIVTDPSRLFRALKDLHPTILVAPPVLYETIETRFFNIPKWKRRTAHLLAKAAGKVPSRAVRHRLARAIFKEVYEALGGRMRFMVTGMAPIKRSTLELFQLMQLPLFETYGMTEFGGITLNSPGANRIGSVGRPLPGVKVELAPDGEVIAVRKYRMASDYFECAEGESAKTFIGTDRVATGDIGRFDKDGYLYLVGRKREMIITTNGLKIHPEIPESEIDACVDVARSVVFTDKHSPMLVAVILPRNPQDESAKDRIREFVEKINDRRPSLAITRIIFTDLAFSRENGFLRPNLKLDRKQIAESFLASTEDSRTLSRSA
jgi:long-subunit acyl-CoA synthetase (AMP-forming)